MPCHKRSYADTAIGLLRQFKHRYDGKVQRLNTLRRNYLHCGTVIVKTMQTHTTGHVHTRWRLFRYNEQIQKCKHGKRHAFDKSTLFVPQEMARQKQLQWNQPSRLPALVMKRERISNWKLHDAVTVNEKPLVSFSIVTQIYVAVPLRKWFVLQPIGQYKHHWNSSRKMAQHSLVTREFKENKRTKRTCKVWYYQLVIIIISQFH